MKNYIFYLAGFIFLTFNIYCSSDNDSFLNQSPPNSNDGEEGLVSIREYGSNSPLSGVKFTTFFCKEYDIQFSKCINEVLFSSCITSDNGTCTFKFPKDNFQGVSVEKAQYWFEHYHEKGYHYILVPEAWVDIHFITSEEYPSTSHFFITVFGVGRYDRSFIQANNNSNETLTLFGNQENKIDWVLYETFNASSKVLNSGSFTLNPEKFENMTYSIIY